MKMKKNKMSFLRCRGLSLWIAFYYTQHYNYTILTQNHKVPKGGARNKNKTQSNCGSTMGGFIADE